MQDRKLSAQYLMFGSIHRKCMQLLLFLESRQDFGFINSCRKTVPGTRTSNPERLITHSVLAPGTRTFSTIRPSLWNALPSSLHLTLLSGSLSSSLSLLNTYFYSRGLRTEWFRP